ncbi:hypothetical protein Tco_1432518, partial [Tanacetum coccineum]
MVTGNNYNRVDYDYYAKTSHTTTHRNMTPRAVLLKSGLKPLSTVRPVYTAHPKPTVYSAKSMSQFSKQAKSTIQRPFYKKPALTNKYFNQKVNTVRPKVVNTARPYTAPVNTIRANGVNVVKPSAWEANCAHKQYLSLVVLLKKVGDEVVHKELGDRMERAATTASSLEAEQDSEFCDMHNMVAYLEKSEGSEGFHQIIDFLNASHIQANGEVELAATIDGQVKTITEASLRRHLKLEDNGGVTTLPNLEIFEQLALMG